MIASSSNSDYDTDVTCTTSTGTESYGTHNIVYVKEKEKDEVEEEIVPRKVTVFKANAKNITFKSTLSSKNKFKIHRTRNR